MTERDRIDAALDLIVKYGWIDGNHHKAWVIDQVTRALTGDDYAKLVAEVTSGGWDWDEGIAP